MLVNLCKTELQNVVSNQEDVPLSQLPAVIESSHPYTHEDSRIGDYVKIPGASCLRIEFDGQCSTERWKDILTLHDCNGREIANLSGRQKSDWSNEIQINGNEMRYKFAVASTGPMKGWGWKMTVYPIASSVIPYDVLSDSTVLSRPSIDLAVCLLGKLCFLLITFFDNMWYKVRA